MKSDNQPTWLKILSNESGSIIVIALLMVTLLAIVVIGGNRASTTEVKIANNKRINERNFYIAEALIAQAAITLENARDNSPDDLKFPGRPGWPSRLYTLVTLADGTTKVRDADFHGWEKYPWITAGPAAISWPNATGVVWENGNPNQATDDFNYIMANSGVVEGGSLDATASQLYEFNLRGRAQSGNGETEISIGYRIRY